MERVQAAQETDHRLLMLKDILSILQEIFLEIPNVFIIVDASDEYFDERTRHRVLLHLQSLASVDILITFRPLPSIEKAMGGVPKLMFSASSEDTNTYFRAHTKTNPKLQKVVPTDSSEHVEAGIIKIRRNVLAGPSTYHRPR